jgi:hypothetical protein
MTSGVIKEAASRRDGSRGQSMVSGVNGHDGATVRGRVAAEFNPVNDSATIHGEFNTGETKYV